MRFTRTVRQYSTRAWRQEPGQAPPTRGNRLPERPIRIIVTLAPGV